MYKIQLNMSGTRFLNITNEHLQTVKKYSLFRDLVDSSGYIDEAVLEKLKFNIRSIIGSSKSDAKDLLNLAAEVIYNDNMKSDGLRQLMILYVTWSKEHSVK